MEQRQSFLQGFGDLLLDGLRTGAALELQSRFAPRDDRVFTVSDSGFAVPRGEPVQVSGSGLDNSNLIILGVVAFFAFKAFV